MATFALVLAMVALACSAAALWLQSPQTYQQLARKLLDAQRETATLRDDVEQLRVKVAGALDEAAALYERAESARKRAAARESRERSQAENGAEDFDPQVLRTLPREQARQALLDWARSAGR